MARKGRRKKQNGKHPPENFRGMKSPQEATVYTYGLLAGHPKPQRTRPTDDDLINYDRPWYSRGRWSDVIVPGR